MMFVSMQDSLKKDSSHSEYLIKTNSKKCKDLERIEVGLGIRDDKDLV